MQTFRTFQLPLGPLPAFRGECPHEFQALPMEDFVDHDVIASLIALPHAPRIHPAPADLILSADDNDFAGWSIRAASPFRIIAEKQELAASRSLPEIIAEPGLLEPHRGNHRWWIAAVAGAASSLILSLLLLNLSDRSASGNGHAVAPESPVQRLQAALASLAS